jgi:hypothetical protein
LGLSLPDISDEVLCHLKRSRFSRIGSGTCVIPVHSTGPGRLLRKASCRLPRPTPARVRTDLDGKPSSKNKKRETAMRREPSPWPSVRDAVLFHTLQTSSTVSVDRWSQGRDASESMEVLSTLMIGNNVMRVAAQGTQERLVAGVATARAGYTTATEDGARNTGSLKSQHPLAADYS